MADKIAGRSPITVAELCRQYLIDVEAGRLLTRRKIAKKESTLISDRGRIARHIVPLLGRIPVKAVRRDDVERFMHDVASGITASTEKTKPRGLSIVRGGRGVAGRTVLPSLPTTIKGKHGHATLGFGRLHAAGDHCHAAEPYPKLAGKP